jgi:LacI family transcriptional regulator
MEPRHRKRAPNIKDVARLADVSPAAVSYVLNGTGSVSEDTAERVREAARRLGYRPNFLARGLKTNRTRMLGVVAEDITVFNTPPIIDGINEVAEQHGYSLLLENLMLNKRIGHAFERASELRGLFEEALEEILARKVDGVVYVGMHSRDVTGLFDPPRVPFVYVYAETAREDDWYVTYDDRATAYQAGQYLVGAGHREIGVVLGPSGPAATTRRRLEGFTAALEEHGVTLSPERMVSGDWEYESGYAAAAELLADRRVTAVFAMNDLMALGVMAYCREHDIAVPEAVSVIGFDNRESSRYFVPRLTTMALPLHRMGELAADRAIAAIEGEPVSERRVRLPGTLLERESVKTA